MAQAFNAGLFEPIPVDSRFSREAVGQPSSGLGFAAQAINNATTKSEGNVFDTITKPLRQRKRREAHIEATTKGYKTGSVEYLDYMEGKLNEFGDMEGADIVANKKLEVRKAESDIANTESSTGLNKKQGERIDADIILNKAQLGLDTLKTTADIENMKGELEVARRNASSNEQRVAIDQMIAKADVRLKASQSASLDAGTATENQTRGLTIDKLRADIDETVANTGMKQAQAKILDAVGLPQAQADLDTTLQALDEAKKDATRKADIAPLEKKYKEAQIAALEASGKADLMRAEAAVTTAGQGTTKSREVNANDIKLAKKEAIGFMKEAGITGTDDQNAVAMSVAYQLEAQRVLMGDRNFQVINANPEARKQMVKEALDTVLKDNTKSTFFGFVTGGKTLKEPADLKSVTDEDLFK